MPHFLSFCTCSLFVRVQACGWVDGSMRRLKLEALAVRLDQSSNSLLTTCPGRKLTVIKNALARLTSDRKAALTLTAGQSRLLTSVQTLVQCARSYGPLPAQCDFTHTRTRAHTGSRTMRTHADASPTHARMHPHIQKNTHLERGAGVLRPRCRRHSCRHRRRRRPHGPRCAGARLARRRPTPPLR